MAKIGKNKKGTPDGAEKPAAKAEAVKPKRTKRKEVETGDSGQDGADKKKPKDEKTTAKAKEDIIKALTQMNDDNNQGEDEDEDVEE